MIKLMKILCIIALGTAVALITFYFFTVSKTDFNFANNGKIICVTKKDWGFASKGDLTCFGVVPLGTGIDNLIQTVQEIDKNGEIILKK